MRDALLTAVMLAVALVADPLMLRAVPARAGAWRTGSSLLGAMLLAAAAGVLLQPAGGPVHASFALGGAYLLSGLVWRWWKESLPPARWSGGEVLLAAIAALMFAAANTGPG